MNEQVDANVPLELLHTQVWMGQILARPLIDQNRIQPFSPSGKALDQEALEWIAPSQTLTPIERLEIYSQQYWWRLLKILLELFPALFRATGPYEFNENIAIPYLTKNPSNHWLLRTLGDSLPEWILKNYPKQNRKFLASLAEFDLMIEKAFRAESQPISPLSTSEELLTIPVQLNSYVFLYSSDWEIAKFRKELMHKDVDYWQKHPLPNLLQEKNYFFLIHRDLYGQIGCQEIIEEEFFFLELLAKGQSIDQACELIETQFQHMYETIAQNLSRWLEKWISYKIIFFKTI